MLRRPLVVTVVVSALALGACGSSSNPSATGGAGGSVGGAGGSTGGSGGGGGGSTGGSGGGGAGGAGANPFKCGAPGMSTKNSCTQAENDAYGKCIKDKCGASFSTCFGPNYQTTGQIGGQCAAYFTCYNACDCSNFTCQAACVTMAGAAECITCLGGATSCIQSMCPTPACAIPDGGTNFPDGGSNFDANFNFDGFNFDFDALNIKLDVGTGTSCADLQKCCDKLPATSQEKAVCMAAVSSGQANACALAMTLYCK